MKDPVFQLTDLVRETAYAIHVYHGPGHLEKVYENALAHRLRKRGLRIERQKPLTVYDEDGTVIGEYFADLVVEEILILELKAAKTLVDEHYAQILGYLRSARLEHGVLINFGNAKFQIRKLAMSEERHRTIADYDLKDGDEGRSEWPKRTKEDERNDDFDGLWEWPKRTKEDERNDDFDGIWE